MEINNITIGKISNVCTRNNDKSCYFCKVELTDDNDKEIVNYVARASDNVEIGKYIYEQITSGNIEGKISNVKDGIDPWTKEIVPDRSAEIVKDERNRRLTATDWTQLPDVPQTVKDKWSVYRQALRDITKQEGYPKNVVWPEQPL